MGYKKDKPEDDAKDMDRTSKGLEMGLNER
jgi:hypothetical protein